jgi:flagellar biosynthesis anti-sigma factor FlgM
MVQAVRPQDASGIYQRSVGAAAEAEAAAPGRSRPPAEGGRTRRADAVALSEQAQALVRARQTVDEAPDVRESLVAALRQQVLDGNYAVDPDAIADAMTADGASA